MNQIEILPWDDNFDTGLEEIDIQHRKLVSILNHLATSITYKADRDELSLILDELADYTIYHFETEEKIWKRYLSHDPLEIQHTKTHQDFINVVASFRMELESSTLEEIAEKILAFLSRWLASHILQDDRYLAYIVLALQERDSIDDAKAVAEIKMQELTHILIDIVLSSYRKLSRNSIHLISEIQKRRQKEEKLQLAASVFTHAREGILISDANNKIKEVNNTFCRITGYQCNEVIGKSPRVLHSGKQNKKFYLKMWQSLKDEGFWSGEIWNKRKNGEIYPEMLTISVVYDDEGAVRNYVALFSDITATKQHQSQLEHIAHYDALTNLPNRLLLADRLSQALRNSQRNNLAVGVAFIDIDGFKEVNDSYGHNVGDKLLVKLSTRMKHTLRNNDFIARVGGDEFLIILTELKTIEDPYPVLERILSAVSEPIIIGSLTLQVTASIGLSLTTTTENIDGDILIRQADQAMYQAKQLGKNRYYVFDTAKDNAIYMQHENLEQIRKSLKNQEFLLHYQPKVNMATGKVIGVEALIRWQHPKHGLIQPNDFLPIIEDHSLSIEIGEWVIDTALYQIEDWKAIGIEMPVSVNINAMHLQQKEFVSRLKELLAKHPTVEPRLLQLEILETSAIGDIIEISATMNSCLDLGVEFALDDFGTGYSSLTYLRRLPAKVIKIDQVFIRDMLIDPDDLSIVEGVIGLTKAFRRDVIAEGVESIEHGKALLQIGCKLAQGYVISRPLEASKIAEWFASWKPDASWSRFVSNKNNFHIHSELDHGHWIGALQEYIRGEKDAPPPMEADKCHFGYWLQEEGFKQFHAHPEFPLLIKLHDELHLLGQEIIELHNQKNYDTARSKEVEVLESYGKQIKKIEEILSS